MRRIALPIRDRVLLEASGGVTLDNVRAIAETGVQRISVGAITHSAVGADVAMEMADEADPAGSANG
jgi:nicotinate-nucleotide pyrophosphorylase (carboxylating)